MPSTRASVLARGMKASVTTVAVGLPLFSISTASWTLHDVQAPQSPEPVITRSQVLASSSRTDPPPTPAWILRRLTTSPTW